MIPHPLTTDTERSLTAPIEQAFSQLLGQTQAVQLLSRAIVQDRIAPAYLFVGPQGVGRSLGARCFIHSLYACLPRPPRPTAAPDLNASDLTGPDITAPPNRTTPPSAHSSQPQLTPTDPNLYRILETRIYQDNHPDILWVWPTYSNKGKLLTPKEAEEAGFTAKTPPQVRLEQIRDITRFLSRPPLEASRSIVVIEAAETMAEGAANALLKTLEEPGQATLILLAPSPSSLLPTLVSRCQRIPFHPLSPEVLATVLTRQDKGEIIQQPALLALAEGSPGSAIANAQRLASIPPEILDMLRDRWPSTPRQALSLASTLTKAMAIEDQLWLLSYLQTHYWHSQQGAALPRLDQLEAAKQALLKYVSPQLVWEVTLLGSFVS